MAALPRSALASQHSVREAVLAGRLGVSLLKDVSSPPGLSPWWLGPPAGALRLLLRAGQPWQRAGAGWAARPALPCWGRAVPGGCGSAGS